MRLSFTLKGFVVPKKKFAAATLLTSGTLAWFFLLNFYIFEEIPTIVTPNEPLNYYNIAQVLFYGFAIFSAIIGSFIGTKISRRKLLFSWTMLGIISTIAVTLFHGIIFLAIISLLLGVSLGLGLPTSMSFIADCTVIEERARVSGIIILATFVLAFAAMAIIRVLSLDLIYAIILFAVVRSTSLLALAIDSCETEDQRKIIQPRLRRIAYKEFLFYLFPWVMFSVAAGLAMNLIPTGEEFEQIRALGTNLRYVCIAIFGVVAGITADKFGRKQPIIIALILLGVSFALLGFNINQTSALIYLVLSGIAWGLLFVVFLAVPGDLSASGSREKFYAIGYIAPVAILFGIASIPGPTVTAFVSATLLSQILSIILFLSIIPIWRATETLPKEKTYERKMKEHLDKVEELVQENK